jgi:hypothetical protein
MELRKIIVPGQTGPVLRFHFRARRLRAKIKPPATRLERVTWGFA